MYLYIINEIMFLIYTFGVFKKYPEIFFVFVFRKLDVEYTVGKFLMVWLCCLMAYQPL